MDNTRATPVWEDELVDLFLDDGLDPEALDGLVIDLFCAKASNVNNQGIEGQIGFLIHELPISRILKKAGYCEHNLPEGKGCPTCEALEHRDQQYHQAKDDGLL